jgi:hypothetical protein
MPQAALPLLLSLTIDSFPIAPSSAHHLFDRRLADQGSTEDGETMTACYCNYIKLLFSWEEKSTSYVDVQWLSN